LEPLYLFVLTALPHAKPLPILLEMLQPGSPPPHKRMRPQTSLRRIPERQTPDKSRLPLYLFVLAAFMRRQVIPLDCKMLQKSHLRLYSSQALRDGAK